MFKSRKSHGSICADGFRYSAEPRRSVTVQIDRLIPVALAVIFAAFAAAYLTL